MTRREFFGAAAAAIAALALPALSAPACPALLPVWRLHEGGRMERVRMAALRTGDLFVHGESGAIMRATIDGWSLPGGEGAITAEYT